VGGIRALLILVVAWPLAGCFEPSGEARASLAQVQKYGRELDRLLDEVEGRMLGNQAKLQLWEEMSRRHQKVSALACQSAVNYTAQLLALQQRQSKRERRLGRSGYPGRAGGVGGPAPTRVEQFLP
jgi:hypothetical protein